MFHFNNQSHSMVILIFIIFLRKKKKEGNKLNEEKKSIIVKSWSEFHSIEWNEISKGESVQGFRGRWNGVRKTRVITGRRVETMDEGASGTVRTCSDESRPGTDNPKRDLPAICLSILSSFLTPYLQFFLPSSRSLFPASTVIRCHRCRCILITR